MTAGPHIHISPRTGTAVCHGCGDSRQLATGTVLAMSRDAARFEQEHAMHASSSGGLAIRGAANHQPVNGGQGNGKAAMLGLQEGLLWEPLSPVSGGGMGKASESGLRAQPAASEAGDSALGRAERDQDSQETASGAGGSGARVKGGDA